MKKTILGTAFALSATFAQADGLSDPIVDPVVIQADAASSSANSAAFVLALITLTVFAAGIKH